MFIYSKSKYIVSMLHERVSNTKLFPVWNVLTAVYVKLQTRCHYLEGHIYLGLNMSKYRGFLQFNI